MAPGVCGYADNVGKNSSNKFEISGVGKKRHIGKERMRAWCGTQSVGVC